jgi:hypothetical protein
MTTPQVTADDVRRLLGTAPATEPALHVITDDDGSESIGVLSKSQAPHYGSIATQEDLVEWTGGHPTAEAIAELLPELQQTADRIAAGGV